MEGWGLTNRRITARGTAHDRAGADEGFTLVELLIVIVILGILATVTVVAVRGITDQGESSACESELTNLVSAEASHEALYGGYATEAELVTNGLASSESSLYDVTIAGDGSYSISPGVTSTCTGTASGGAPLGGPTGPDRSTYAISVASSAFGNFHGNPAHQVSPTPGEPDEVVVLGRSEALLGWHDMLNNPQPNTRRVTLIHLDELTEAEIRSTIGQSRNSGVTTIAVYAADDPGGVALAVVDDELTNNPDPSDEPRQLLVAEPAPGKTLTELLVELG